MWIDRDAWGDTISTPKNRADIPLRSFKCARQLTDLQGPHARDGSGMGSREPDPKGSLPFEHDFFIRH
jgi:hypothetical protein